MAEGDGGDLPRLQRRAVLGYRQFLKEYAGRKGDWRTFSTNYAAPFSGPGRGPVYCCPERTARKWFSLSNKARIEGEADGSRLGEGVSCILPGKDERNTLFLCNRHGIFKTTDLGKTYRPVCRSPAK